MKEHLGILWRPAIAALCMIAPAFGQTYAVTSLTASNELESRAFALNDAGEVAGAFRQASGGWHAFLFNGDFLDLGTLGGTGSEAFAINASGAVVGRSQTASGTIQHAFVYRSGQMSDLNAQISSTDWILTAAIHISDAGQIITIGTRGTEIRAFLLSPASDGNCSGTTVVPGVAQNCYAISPWAGSTDILDLPVQSPLQNTASGTSEPETALIALDSGGDAVGSSTANGTVKHAVLLKSGSSAPVDLNQQIRQDSGWTLQSAVAVNAYGQIAGTGTFGGFTQAFLLTPLQPGMEAARKSSAADPGNVSGSGVGSSATAAGSNPIPNTLALDATGSAGGVLAGQYPNPVLAGITAGPVVFGNGPGTIGQDSSFTFNAASEQLNLNDAANTYGTATLNVGKGIGSSSSLDLSEANNTGKLLRIMQPSDVAKKTPTLYIDNGSGLYMRSWITISGTTNGLTGDGYNIVPPSKDALMLAIWADVATGVQVRTGNVAGAYNYSNLDRHGNYTMSIEEDGGLKWGTSTRAAMDTGLSRNSAAMLEVNNGTKGSFGDLTVRNLIATGSIQFSNALTGGSAAALGANSPATSPSQPATWISVVLPDGSTGYIPVWK
jgi:probable HAF family extracellular repeat protein